MFVTINQAKKQLQIDDSFKEDDDYILSLIQVAEDAVSHHLDYPLQELLEGGELPSSVLQSILLLVGNLYANREPVSYSSAVKVPYTLDYLLGLYKKYSIV